MTVRQVDFSADAVDWEHTRLLFGVSPNFVFRRGAGNCTRDAAGRVRSPEVFHVDCPL